MTKLAIISTHPIQYYAPVFQLLQQRKLIQIKVFYTWGDKGLNKHDPGFGKQVVWDIPLVNGYDYEWVENISKQPGSHHFKGIINPTLIPQVNSYAPDAVLIFGWAYHSHLKAVRYFKNKIPVLFRGDSTLLDEAKGVRSILKSIFLKWVYRHVDHAFYVGSNNKAYFKKYGLKDDQLSFAPHAVDNQRFAAPHANEVDELRKSLGLTPDSILITFTGKFENKKSPQLLLDAFLALDKPYTHILFVGNGHLEHTLKAKATSNPNVHFIDFKNQSYMPVVYQACDIFCLPSKGPGETWGLAVNEAMASSKAILISDKCGCAIDLVGPDNGIIFRAGDTEELILGLKKITANVKTLTGLGQQSGIKIKDWSFLNMAIAMENKVNEAIKTNE